MADTHPDGAQDELHALAHDAFRAYDEFLEATKAQQPPEAELACHAGCSHCCRNQPEITATPIEVLNLAGVILATFDADGVVALKERLAQMPAIHGSDIAGRPSGQWQLRTCPLLQDDGTCSVYDDRPLLCRGANAYVETDCIEAVELNRATQTIRAYVPQEAAAQRTLEALSNGIQAAGRDGALLDFWMGLRMALEDPSVIERWQSGEDVLGPAKSYWQD